MKNEYILNLYRQYCSSLGKEYKELNVINDLDFILWVQLLNKQTKLYGEYLRNLYSVLTSSQTIEIDKGKYDSLGSELTTIISPFAETLGYRNSNLCVFNNKPFVLMGTSVFVVDNCELFLTHNPYQNVSINDLILLHNIGSNICIGIYGDIADKDKKVKLKLLQETVKKCQDDLVFYYDTIDNNYFSVIKTERKVKKKILTK